MNEIIINNDDQIKTDIESKILVIRGQQVMIDRDLAEFYCMKTKRLNEQVKRNIERFPEEFCFQLTKTEFENWRSHFATSNSDKMGLRRPPYAFTEQGVLKNPSQSLREEPLSGSASQLSLKGEPRRASQAFLPPTQGEVAAKADGEGQVAAKG